jgi:hypothetical protein
VGKQDLRHQLHLCVELISDGFYGVEIEGQLVVGLLEDLIKVDPVDPLHALDHLNQLAY